jgi:hypothetical protein
MISTKAGDRAAISFAPEGAPEDRFYAGMDMCLTPAFARYHARPRSVRDEEEGLQGPKNALAKEATARQPCVNEPAPVLIPPPSRIACGRDAAV